MTYVSRRSLSSRSLNVAHGSAVESQSPLPPLATTQTPRSPYSPDSLSADAEPVLATPPGAPVARSQPPRPLRSSVAARPPARSPQPPRWENGLQIGFNVLVSIAALTSLIHLLPQQKQKTAALEALEAKVADRQARVDRLQASFQYYFDPAQTPTVIRQESQKIDPKQRPIVWTDSP